eukprot:TRINITY_DN8965_c0_g1_i2.p4 TRINITY_DN8965_c0_g1~~TRINITY_DN8965_c0_g1_i2.p4  ORF type:complete len:112 (+),score=28.34 TRINITY_DN8965_c0_g1_i2:512-847(+)
MGFPERFSFGPHPPGSPGYQRAYRLLGNAVCPPLIAALGAALAGALRVGGAAAPAGALPGAAGRGVLLAAADPEERLPQSPPPCGRAAAAWAPPPPTLRAALGALTAPRGD